MYLYVSLTLECPIGFAKVVVNKIVFVISSCDVWVDDILARISIHGCRFKYDNQNDISEYVMYYYKVTKSNKNKETK